MLLNEQGFWRLLIAGGMGLGAAVIAVFIDAARKDPKVPITAGLSVGVAAYLIDWYTEKRGQ